MNDWVSIVFMSFGLSMDAFAVSVSDGLGIKALQKRHIVFIALTFGLLQGLMPLVGYFLGSLFLHYIDAYLGYISFALLVIIGTKMIVDGISSLKGNSEEVNKPFSFGGIIFQGIATSIDALAVGITLLDFSINIFCSAGIICIITFAVCLLGVWLGKKFGSMIKGKNGIADIVGGAILAILAVSFLFR
jgi:putative Mn2+ efflux pump MntP